MTLEKRLDKLEERLQAERDLDDEIERGLNEMSIEEREAFLREFVRTHEFYDPSVLTDEERAMNVWLNGERTMYH